MQSDADLLVATRQCVFLDRMLYGLYIFYALESKQQPHNSFSPQRVEMLRRLTKHLKYAVVYFPVDDSVSRIATKDVVMVEGGGEMKERSKEFVLVKRERYWAYILYISSNY